MFLLTVSATLFSLCCVFIYKFYSSLKINRLKIMLTKIQDVPVLSKEYVRIRNPEELLKKINKLITDGSSKLQIVTDFDYTLTRQNMDNGKKVLSSFGMFSMCPSVPQRYRVEDERLCDYYKPIEVDPTISREEKTKHMVNWYIAGNSLLKNIIFPRAELMEVATGMIDCFRIGVDKLISWSVKQQVPVLVFSAGLGESVEAALRAARFLHPNVKVVSNYLAMDENDKIVGIKGSIIHMLNKNETAIQGTEYYELVRQRGNVLLMGDSVGDAGMADGLEHCELALKIGFLYHNVEGNLHTYLQHFDIVLIDDQTMDVANALLQLLM